MIVWDGHRRRNRSHQTVVAEQSGVATITPLKFLEKI